MKKIDLGQTINTLANLGVIGGIIFLGVELQQNTASLAFQARATGVDQAAIGWITISQEPELIDILIKDRSGETLTTAEEIRLNAWWMRNLLMWEWRFQEFPDAEEYWAGPRRLAPTYGSLRRTWQGNEDGAVGAGKDTFSSEFVEFLDATVFNQ